MAGKQNNQTQGSNATNAKKSSKRSKNSKLNQPLIAFNTEKFKSYFSKESLKSYVAWVPSLDQTKNHVQKNKKWYIGVPIAAALIFGTFKGCQNKDKINSYFENKFPADTELTLQENEESSSLEKKLPVSYDDGRNVVNLYLMGDSSTYILQAPVIAIANDSAKIENNGLVAKDINIEAKLESTTNNYSSKKEKAKQSNYNPTKSSKVPVEEDNSSKLEKSILETSNDGNNNFTFDSWGDKDLINGFDKAQKYNAKTNYGTKKQRKLFKRN